MASKDPVRLRHMLDASGEAIRMSRARTRAELDGDRMLELALTRCLEIVGEAAARVSAECRSEHPGIPWPAIVGMRNQLIHAYFEVDRNILWDTVKTDLPPLVTALEAILEGFDESTE